MSARILSIDIEATGLDPDTCQVIEFAAVLYTTGDPTPAEQLPYFHRRVYHPVYQGEPFALAMHAGLFRELASFRDDPDWQKSYVAAGALGHTFAQWLKCRGFGADADCRVQIKAAGKNFASYDRVFLKALPGWNRFVGISGRVFDPGILYFDPKTDDDIPGTAECLRRAGLMAEAEHTALGDARDVVRLLQHKFGDVRGNEA